MLAKIQATFRIIGRQIHDLRILHPPTFNSRERTETTWARVIESYNKVPEAYKEFFAPFSNAKIFPYSVLTPAFETLGYRITEKILCLLEDEINILERSGKALTIQCYPLGDINYVESSRMLLDSRIKISGITKQGIQTFSMARFSSATDHIMAAILRNIRLHAAGSKESTQDRDLEKFDPWMDLNFKFMNMARQSLVGGEKVIHAVLQPEIRKRIFTLSGKTYSRMIAPTQAIILTDRELIVIREDASHSRKDRYGGIWQYFPLHKIAILNMDPKPDSLLALSIQLITGERFEYLFQVSMKDQIGLLLTRFGKMKDDR